MTQYQQAVLAYVADPSDRNHKRVRVLNGTARKFGSHLAPLPRERYDV